MASPHPRRIAARSDDVARSTVFEIPSCLSTFSLTDDQKAIYIFIAWKRGMTMRRLKPPTLQQWGCPHQWKTTHSLPQAAPLQRVRRYKCLRCGLRVKTEERLAVPWDERNLLALLQGLLPERQPVYLRERGITALPLYGLNSILERQGYVIHAFKVRDAKRFVTCTDKQGRVEQYGLFELRQNAQEPPRRAIRRKTGAQRGGAKGEQ